MIALADGISVGEEGGFSCQFKADATSGTNYLWYLADTVGGTKGEYRIEIVNNLLYFALWSDKGGASGTGGYAVNTGTGTGNQSIPFTDTSSWHTLDCAWKNGSPTLITLDGVVERTITNVGLLDSFTSGAGLNVLGALPQTPPNSYFAGQMQNVVIRNTYAVPEPAACVTLTIGLIGLLAYAWRKQR
jgi:hypothetical protein